MRGPKAFQFRSDPECVLPMVLLVDLIVTGKAPINGLELFGAVGPRLSRPSPGQTL